MKDALGHGSNPHGAHSAAIENLSPKPVKGLRFYHSRVLASQKFDGHSPQLFQVTKVASGTAYFRPVYDLGGRETFGAPGMCPVEEFSRWCLRAA